MSRERAVSEPHGEECYSHGRPASKQEYAEAHLSLDRDRGAIDGLHGTEAFAIFAPTDVQGVVAPKSDKLPRLEARHAEVVRTFIRVADEDDLAACVAALEAEEVRADFNDALRRFSQSLDMLLPDSHALKHRGDARWLGKIRAAAVTRDRDSALAGCQSHQEAPEGRAASRLPANVVASGSSRVVARERAVALRLHAHGIGYGAVTRDWPKGVPAFADVVQGEVSSTRAA